MSLLTFIKGLIGETAGAVAHWVFLEKDLYHPLNNITLQTGNGTTQIDHIVVSKFGIFVIEAKNIDGWIFGDARSPRWTVSKPGRKFQIQNPLHQNYRHVKAVVEFLGVEETKVHSMVMFWGECAFKTVMPKNVISSGYATYIKSFRKELLSDTEVASAVKALRSGALPAGWSTRNAHLASLASRHANTTTCAKCGSPLVLRTARRSGSRFYGCAAFPKCRNTVPYQREA